MSKSAYNPGPAEARSVVLVETTLLTKQSIKKKCCFVGSSGDRSGLTAAEFVGVVQGGKKAKHWLKKKKILREFKIQKYSQSIFSFPVHSTQASAPDYE